MQADEHCVVDDVVDGPIHEAIVHILSLSPEVGAEKRIVPRVPYHKAVQVTKDNKTDLCPARDLSQSGVGFLHTKPVYGRIIVGLSTPTGDHYRLLSEVVRARQVGRFYEMGARFVERIV